METPKEVEIPMTNPDELPRWSDVQTSAVKPSEVALEDSVQALRPREQRDRHVWSSALSEDCPDGNPYLRFLEGGAPRKRRKQYGSTCISKPLKKRRMGL